MIALEKHLFKTARLKITVKGKLHDLALSFVLVKPVVFLHFLAFLSLEISKFKK